MKSDYSTDSNLSVRSEQAIADPERLFMGRIYNWMTAGLAISGVTAWQVAESMTVKTSIFWRVPGLFIGLFIAELVLVAVLSAAIKKLSPAVAMILFCAYAVLTGITLAPLAFIYTSASIFSAFITCSGVFFATSLFGYLTKRNLSSVGSFCFMGLIGIIIATIVNFFLKSEMMEYIISYAGVAIFIGLTAWDTQKFRSLAAKADADSLESADMKKFAILGALTLYLDFINLFLFLLRIMGGRRN